MDNKETKNVVPGEIKSEVKAEVKAEPKAEVKAEVKAEPKAEVKADVKAEPKAEAKAPAAPKKTAPKAASAAPKKAAPKAAEKPAKAAPKAAERPAKATAKTAAASAKAPAKTSAKAEPKKPGRPAKAAPAAADTKVTPGDADQKAWKYIYNANMDAKKNPDRIALISMDRSYTYRQMFRNWEKYAEVFSALGITEENHSRLAVFDCSCVESSFAFYGANMTGASVAGFAPAYLSIKFPLGKAIKMEGITDLFINDLVINDKMLVNILRQKKELGLRNVIICRVVIEGEGADRNLVEHSRANYEKLREVKGALFMDDLLSRYEAYPISYSTKNNDEYAFIMHTSGTTKGISKPAPLSDRAINIAAENMKKSGKFEQFRGGSVSLCSMVATSVYGFVNQLHEPLAFGCTVVVPPMSTTNPLFVKFIGKYKVNILFLTPFYFEVWSKLPPEFVPDFTSVTCVVIGGAYLSAEARSRYKAFCKAHGGEPAFINGYGMSETCGACIIQTDEVDNDSIGYPLPGVDVKIYDEVEEAFYSIKDKHTGVLYINSESLSLGKVDGNEFFKLDNIDGKLYICTNDVVCVNDDGSLACQGRANRYFVNNEGVKFDAGVVETLVSAEKGIESCAVTPWYDKLLTHDTVPVLYVQTIDQGEPATVTVKNALVDVFITQGKAKETNLPMQCVITKQIPHNQNGKVDIYKITNGGVPGDRYIIRPIREDDLLKDIVLEYAQDTGEGLANGAVPAELTTVWDNVRESAMDETVLNQASNVFNAKLMSALAGSGMLPGATQQAQFFAQMITNFWNMQQQFINQSMKMMQDFVNNFTKGFGGFQISKDQQLPQLPYIPQGLLSAPAAQGGGQGQAPQVPYAAQNPGGGQGQAPQMPYAAQGAGQDGNQPKFPQFPYMMQGCQQGQAPQMPYAAQGAGQDGNQPKFPQFPYMMQGCQQGQAPQMPYAAQDPQQGQAPQMPYAAQNPQQGQAPQMPYAAQNPQQGQAPQMPYAAQDPQQPQAPQMPYAAQPQGPAPETKQ